MNYTNFDPFTNENNSTLEQAWSLMIGNKLSDAKRLLAYDAPLSDSADAANYWMLVGIITCLEADYCQAEDHFGTALDYFEAMDQTEKAMTIRLYFAYLYEQSGAADLATYHLNRAMAWLDANYVSVIQYWWHPTIITAILNEAISTNCFPMRARLIQEQSRFYHARRHKKGKVSTRILLCML